MSGEIKNRTVYMLCRTHKPEDGTDIYIGSTSQSLPQRFSQHKQDTGNPSRLKYHGGGSRLYQRMREVGVHNFKIVPLLTFACNRDTIFEFEREWVKAIGANLNTFSPISEDVAGREYQRRYGKKNKEKRRYCCALCNLTSKSKYNLERHFDTLKHSYAWLNSLD